MDSKTLEKGPLNGRGSGQKITTHVFATPVSAQDAESQLNEPNTGTYDVLFQPPAPSPYPPFRNLATKIRKILCCGSGFMESESSISSGSGSMVSMTKN
jgi:hypothetical protein